MRFPLKTRPLDNQRNEMPSLDVAAKHSDAATLAKSSQAGPHGLAQRQLTAPSFAMPLLQHTYGNRNAQAILARAHRRKAAHGVRSNAAVLPQGNGHAIDAQTRKPFEAHFQSDFSDVRVHTGSDAADSAEQLDAVAYTTERDIYFSSGTYAPSSSEGKRLLAHELAHVVQQKRDSTQSDQPTVRRKPVPQQKLPEWREPETFTLVKTRNLDASGPYTEYLLHFISSSWTQMTGRPWIAQQVVDALESSAYFVRIARELDAFYRKRPHPRFTFSFSLTGTKYVPAGSPVQYAKTEPIWIDPDADTIDLDYARSAIEGSDERQIAAFVGAIIHESTHAFDHIKEITAAGLSGDLEEEQRTRKAEIRGLQQIKAGTTNAALNTELDTRIANIKSAGFTKKEIAKDLISVGDFTYLESFYVGSAVGQFLSGEMKARARLDPATSEIAAQVGEIAAYDDLNYPLLLANAEYSVVMNSPLDTDKPLSRKFPISAANKALLLRLLKTSMTLKELTETRSPSMTAEEQLLFFHILLVKTHHLRSQIQGAWAASSSAAETAEKNARNFLGRPNVYSQIKD
jgi:hypothetical protein